MTFFTAKLHCNSIIYLLFRANIESTITYHATTTITLTSNHVQGRALSFMKTCIHCSEPILQQVKRRQNRHDFVPTMDPPPKLRQKSAAAVHVAAVADINIGGNYPKF
jgi:hypothetical protein